MTWNKAVSDRYFHFPVTLQVVILGREFFKDSPWGGGAADRLEKRTGWREWGVQGGESYQLPGWTRRVPKNSPNPGGSDLFLPKP